ncbi:MAG: winged helix-turn-helix domain-containing protein, partial [Candidatus Woesearchaeota archaeon]|nr:winged helix-turn-helix domain-containing protein [Candidatus Woesearchaeota archaeon]
MLNKKDWIIAAHLRQNSRIPLTDLSRKTGIPVSTLFDHIKNQNGELYAKHIALINFTRLGYSTKAHILVRAPKQTKDTVQRFLEAHWNVNTIYKINNKYDFMAECIFKHMKELQ